MVKNILKILFVVFGIFFLVYLSWPAPPFPTGLWDFKMSTEPADHETPLRQGYYTNTTRDQLMTHYEQSFSWGIVLNYPPEDAQTLIRDQTKSTFLQEIVHPMRESIYVNGYKPKPNVAVLEIDGVHYDQKVIIKYVGSNLFVRLGVGILTLGLIWIVFSEWGKTINFQKWISR